jgi:ribosome-binding protein aMBF1 (putative translation factor)
MTRQHRTYKQIKQKFSPEMRAEISAGADSPEERLRQRIRTELKIISTVRQAAGLTQEELADLLEVRQSYISQVEARENITLTTLISTIAAMGGSIDLTVNFPEKPSVQFSQIETSFLSNQQEL